MPGGGDQDKRGRKKMPYWIGKDEMVSSSRDFEEEQDHGTKCNYCDMLFESDEIRKTFGDEDNICPYCMSDFDFVECQCGAVFEKDETFICISCGSMYGKEEE